jgi:copper chaperone NosL
MVLVEHAFSRCPESECEGESDLYQPSGVVRISRKGTLMKGAALIVPLAVLIFWGSVSAQELQNVRHSTTCKYCRMNTAQHPQTRVVIEYDDGTRHELCSIYCAAIDLAINLDKSPKSISVGDYYSKELIDAESAFWVIGGIKTGVMTKRGKWAFLEKKEAENFMSENGGQMAIFDQALQATYEEMYEDSKMIRSRKAIKRMHN